MPSPFLQQLIASQATQAGTDDEDEQRKQKVQLAKDIQRMTAQADSVKTDIQTRRGLSYEARMRLVDIADSLDNELRILGKRWSGLKDVEADTSTAEPPMPPGMQGPPPLSLIQRLQNALTPAPGGLHQHVTDEFDVWQRERMQKLNQDRGLIEELRRSQMSDSL